MRTRHVKTWLLSGLAGAAMLLGAGSAQAMGFKLGEADLNVDTTVSLGIGVRTSKQDCGLVSKANGGCGAGAGVSFGVNDDDGNVNTDQWDPYSIVLKVTSDVELKYQNYGAFARVKAFYDYWADQQLGTHDNQYGRRPLQDNLRGDDAINAASRDLQLLDAFVYGNFDIGEQRLTLRAGKQVINWGESLLIPGGISSYLPVDVGALRTPGAELKEAYQPVPALYASLSLPNNISVEAFWQALWQETKLDACGTFFATTDAACTGGMYVMSGGEFVDGDLPGLNMHGITPVYVIDRRPSQEGTDGRTYGAALKYYADWLNDGTDMGLYFVNYSSTLPIGTWTSVNLLNFLAGTEIKHVLLQYPDDIKTIGGSFNTTIPVLGGSAFSGEVAYTHDMPFALVDVEENCHDVATTLGIPVNAMCRPQAQTVGKNDVIPGYDRFNVVTGQLAMISTLPTSNPMTQAIGSDLVVFVANAGFQYIPGLTSANNRLAAPRAANFYGNYNAYSSTVQALLGDPACNASTCHTLYATPFSWGYRLILNADYNNAFGTAATVSPTIQFAHDVDGYSAGPIGPGFVQNKKVVTLGLNGKYRDWRASIAYTYNWGNSFRNFSSDKDFATATISYAF